MLCRNINNDYRLRAIALPIIEISRLLPTFVITVYHIHIMVRTPFVVDHLTARKAVGIHEPRRNKPRNRSICAKDQPGIRTL
ncbi:hypothetical protein BJX64DRAFT_234442 [Aspergillus heterothallicus]